jgi:hypothetical protein
VSAACLTVQSFDERLEQAVGCIRGLEEKLLNMARLVSCTQQFAEAQEAQQREGVAEVGRRLRAVEAAVEELAQPGRAAEWEAKLRAGERRGGRNALGGAGHIGRLGTCLRTSHAAIAMLSFLSASTTRPSNCQLAQPALQRLPASKASWRRQMQQQRSA